MKLEVLISCMGQDNLNIAKTTHVTTDVLIVNQHVVNCFFEKRNINGTVVRMFSTVERGLSKSRNMALKKSKGDICLFCDDDEILSDSYECTILKVFKDLPQADVIAFRIENAGKKYSSKRKKLNYLTALKVGSWQIAFRKESIINNNIWFDETLGSGISKAGGEENMFLYDCLRKGLCLYYYPVSIGRMIEGESKWFHGFTEEYFFDRGIFTRKLMGCLGAILYGFYYLVFKFERYSKDISFVKAFISLYKGIFS